MSNALPYVLAIYPLGLAGIALAWLVLAFRVSASRCVLHVSASASILVFAILAGSWVFTSQYLRIAVLGLFVWAVLHTCRRRPHRRFRRTAASILLDATSILVALVFLALNSLLLTARLPSGAYADLSFPLRDGTYSVLQGGNNIVANPFHALYGNHFPIDLVKLNGFGNRATGIAPRQLQDYEIFGELLHSPCDGTILALRSGMPDNAPGTVNLERTEGNFLIIDCGAAQILMAHLQVGSLLVSTGQTVAAGSPVGRVGNSGNTMEPHLHIEATRGGKPVSLRFDGRVLVVNDLIRT